MKKGTKKGALERRKHPRRAKKPVGKSAAPGRQSVHETPSKRPPNLSDVSALNISQEHCTACGKGLKGEDRALFVEEEVGRVFCSEECITNHFQSDIDVIEKEYFKFRPKEDLTPDEREQYAHLRWITIQEPDEVWQQRLPSGDKRHTLISQFKPGAKPIWCVCICLFLRGEPSFLYMAFPTRSKALVERFRKGESVEWVKDDASTAGRERIETEAGEKTDGLADGWSGSETIRAEIHKTRSSNDIPVEEYGLYEKHLEKTLESPDELWVMESKDDGEPDRYQFIKHFPEEEGGAMYYIVIAQESEQTEHLEVIGQVPTRDPKVANQYRKGRQELVIEEDEGSKTIH